VPNTLTDLVVPDRKGGTAMMSVVEWLAPVRNLHWVAACFGSLG
jgi:hypothetical protein